MGDFYGSSGISDERFCLFLATERHDTGQPNREETEQIELERLPFTTAVELAWSGRVQDAASTRVYYLLTGRYLRLSTHGHARQNFEVL